MKNTYCMVFVGILIFFGCSYPKYREKKDTEFTLYVYVSDSKSNSFKVLVNDTLRYEGKFKENHCSTVGGDMEIHDMCIGNFAKGQHTKIIVGSQEIQNIYECNTLNVDSVMIMFDKNSTYPNMLFGLED